MMRVCFDVAPDSAAGRVIAMMQGRSPKLKLEPSAIVSAEFERFCAEWLAYDTGEASASDEVRMTFALEKETAAAIAKFSEITELTHDQIGEQFLSIVASVIEDGAGGIAHHSLEYWTYDDPKERKRVEARLARMEADELAVELEYKSRRT